MTYVEHHHGPEQTDAGAIDWQPGWYATCDDCGWTAGPGPTEADAIQAADQHAVAMGEATPQQLEREPQPGERLEVAWQASHGRRPDGWWFAGEVPGRTQEEHGPFTSHAAMLAAKLARMQALEAPPTQRPAAPGSGTPAAGRPSSSTSARWARPATAASLTAATPPGRARSAAAPATASRMAAARSIACDPTSRDHHPRPDPSRRRRAGNQDRPQRRPGGPRQAIVSGAEPRPRASRGRLRPVPTTDPQPPHHLEAEQAVLGAVLAAGRLLVEVAALVEEADFYRPAHRTTWRAILARADRGEPTDPSPCWASSSAPASWPTSAAARSCTPSSRPSPPSLMPATTPAWSPTPPASGG